jgi:hypothetical protein
LAALVSGKQRAADQSITVWHARLAGGRVGHVRPTCLTTSLTAWSGRSVAWNKRNWSTV